MTKTVQVQHFDKKGDNIFTEKWKLRDPLTGDYKADKKRLLQLVKKNAHSNKTYPTKAYVVSWGENEGFLLSNEA